ncbi:unnamed protein product [Absidia cylindrospora]
MVWLGYTDIALGLDTIDRFVSYTQQLWTMVLKHNNQLPNQHFRKEWQRRVKTWFNQAGQKKSRRVARVQKATRVAPRPVDGLLRPAVRCPTLRYNMKLRSGRGFTLEEIKEAGLTPKYARTVGIAVDHRRRNRSQNLLNSTPKKGDSEAAEVASAVQFKGPILPIQQVAAGPEARAITAEEKAGSAYMKLRYARSAKRTLGAREKRARDKAEEEANKKK